jgi:Dolichyl-phosphate-mannose-protein mannosyltransferase
MTSNNREFYIVILVIIIAQSLLLFQGFDVCDEGFSLTFYQQIYNAPSSVEYSFVYWLSGILGGLWYSLYHDGGVLWFRILAIIVNTLTFVVSYKILDQFINKRFALIGLTMVLFANNFGFLAFYYNHLTAFLAVSSIYFLLKGLTKKQFVCLCIAGFLSGINVFSRLTNVTLFVFILAIPFMGYFNKEPFIKSVKPMLVFILGIAIGMISIFGILYSLNHIDLMKNAIVGLVDLGKTEGSTHNIITLFETYIYNYKQVIMAFFKLLIICILFLVTKNYFKTNRFVKSIVYLLGFLVLALLFKKGNIYIIYAIAFIGPLGILLTKQKNTSIKTIALLALFMMVFLPLGSGSGIYSSGYVSIWLSMPLFFYFTYQIKTATITVETEHTILSKVLSKDIISQVLVLIVISYFTAKIYNISQEAYFDEGSRFEKTYKINNRFTKGIFTTEERASIINDLIVNLEQYVTPNDYLLAYDKIPMVHFLTETKPYMYNPWVWIYDGYSFNKNLNRAEIEIDVLPIIVQQKFETISNFSEPMLDYMSENKEDIYTYSKERVIAMNDFIKRNQYKIVWSNSYFNIYKSDKLFEID